ncbi:hypothetical protein ASG36_16485 [Geodermatophilus sp. Leaf369]|nr:hypothetical protein ASG36_16485 [Geodermatophilus sp. Leaf369]
MRRYCADNRLNRLGTLTYAGVGCHDPKQVRRDVGQFFRTLRGLLGGEPLPYVWVPEWHKTDHGLHVHFALGRFVPRSLIKTAWPHGFVHIKLLGDLPTGSTSRDEARLAARYLSKYVRKGFDVRRIPGLHRYEVGQGFQPAALVLRGRTFVDVLLLAIAHMGPDPAEVWRSSESLGWEGPPAAWLAWS